MRTHTSLLLWLLTAAACPTRDPPGGETSSAGTSSGSSATPPDLPAVPTSSGDTTSTGQTSTDHASTTADTGDATTGEPPLCGNGTIDPGEHCDFGVADNSDVGYCKTDCSLAECGDGKLWAGVEDCDRGQGGNDGSYGGCRPDCSFSDYCGDAKLHPSESCDAGPLNGTGEHADGYVPCSATCDLVARRVFISSVTYQGNLGGITGADLLCQNLAAAAGWDNPGAVRAWLSDAAASPLTRLTDADPPVPYALVNGKRIAASIADLIASGPGDGITLDELGTPWNSVKVWTNTAVTGDVFSATDHCAGWLSASQQLVARAGHNSLPKLPDDEWKNWSQLKLWTSQASKPCDALYHLYCLEN